MVKKILSITLWVITGAAIIVLFAFGRKSYLETPLKGIHFTVERSHAKGFVQNDSVLAQASAICGMERQAAIGTVDMMQLRRMLDGNPWIAEASAYVGLDDTLVITAREYEPMLRVYDFEGTSVYLTANGTVIPASPHYTPHLIIASGNYDLATGVGFDETLAIAKAIGKDQRYKDHIGQIYRNNDNEYELIVNNLPIQVLIGDTCDIDSKLHRLETLLEKYHGTEELTGYKTMSLKYKNQIVCTKK